MVFVQIMQDSSWITCRRRDNLAAVCGFTQSFLRVSTNQQDIVAIVTRCGQASAISIRYCSDH